MGNTIIKLDNIAKSFGNVRVIEHIRFFQLRREKSTL